MAQLVTINVAQLVTIKMAKRGPVSNFTAYIYVCMYVCMYVCIVDLVPGSFPISSQTWNSFPGSRVPLCDAVCGFGKFQKAPSQRAFLECY